MKSSVFEYDHYKTFLHDSLLGGVGKGRGQKKALSLAMGCQMSHLTNVLSGGGHLSPEQAEASARFLGLNPEETEFFILLIQFNRAGTESLKHFLKTLLSERRRRAADLKSRLKMPESLQGNAENQYYGNWQYAAIHVATSIPALQTREAIALHFSIPLKRVDLVLDFLVKVGMVQKNGLKFSMSETQLHLEKNSQLIAQHHTNWRMKSIQTLDSPHPEALRYSAAVSISAKDYARVREILTRALADAMKVITESKEEKMAMLAIDFLPL